MQTIYDKQSRMVVRRDADNYTALPKTWQKLSTLLRSISRKLATNILTAQRLTLLTPPGGLMIDPPGAGGVNNMRRLSPFCARL